MASSASGTLCQKFPNWVQLRSPPGSSTSIQMEGTWTPIWQTIHVVLTGQQDRRSISCSHVGEGRECAESAERTFLKGGQSAPEFKPADPPPRFHKRSCALRRIANWQTGKCRGNSSHPVSAVSSLSPLQTLGDRPPEGWRLTPLCAFRSATTRSGPPSSAAARGGRGGMLSTFRNRICPSLMRSVMDFALSGTANDANGRPLARGNTFGVLRVMQSR